MTRRRVLLLTALGVMISLAALASQNRSSLLLLDWASKAPRERTPVAVLIEVGLKDDAPTLWNSRAAIAGARGVHREGYRFRANDKLTEPNAWEINTRRPVANVGLRNPAMAWSQRMASAGLVLHLT